MYFLKRLLSNKTKLLYLTRQSPNLSFMDVNSALATMKRQLGAFILVDSV